MVSSSGVVLIRCNGRGLPRSGLRTVAAVPRETSAAAARAETVGRAPWRAACRRAAARARLWAEVGGGASLALGAGVGRVGRSVGRRGARRAVGRLPALGSGPRSAAEHRWPWAPVLDELDGRRGS